MGRSVLTRGRFARADEVPGPADAAAPPTTRRCWPARPRCVPSGLLNRVSVRAFNEVWYRKAPARRRDELQTIPTFFHPLDMVDRWNRIYGPAGLPAVAVRRALRRRGRGAPAPSHRLSASGTTSFVAVLKRFGPGNPGPLSFPMPGWTLAVDIPVGKAGLGRLLDELDEAWSRPAGGSTWPRTAGCGPSCWPPCTPGSSEWREIRQRVDPDQRLRSDLARRLSAALRLDRLGAALGGRRG